MPVRIRLKKTGRRHVNSFRIVVTDARKARDGDVIERVGTYSPEFPDKARQLTVDAERIAYWLSVGAQPSETVASLLRHAGIETPKKDTESVDAKK